MPVSMTPTSTFLVPGAFLLARSAPIIFMSHWRPASGSPATPLMADASGNVRGTSEPRTPDASAPAPVMVRSADAPAALWALEASVGAKPISRSVVTPTTDWSEPRASTNASPPPLART